MSDLHKAYCENCEKNHGYNEVTAVKYGVAQDWGLFKWFFFLVLCILTSFFWLFFAIGWCIVSYPRYRCQNCNKVIEKKDLRL